MPITYIYPQTLKHIFYLFSIFFSFLPAADAFLEKATITLQALLPERIVTDGLEKQVLCMVKAELYCDMNRLDEAKALVSNR